MFFANFGETGNKFVFVDVDPDASGIDSGDVVVCFSMKRSLLGPPSLAIEVLRAAKIDLLSVQRKQLVSTLRF